MKISLTKVILIAVMMRNHVTHNKIKSEYNSLMEDALALHSVLTTTHNQLEYAVHLLNENEIALDEFDLIALPSVTR